MTITYINVLRNRGRGPKHTGFIDKHKDGWVSNIRYRNQVGANDHIQLMINCDVTYSEQI